MTISECVNAQKAFFYTGTTKNIAYRIQTLKKLKNAITAHTDDILAALKKDLNKSSFESYTSEIGLLLEELTNAASKLRRWAKPLHVSTGLLSFPSKGVQYREPFGVVLIMAPWNYPFQLAIAPLIGAIAGGNCAVVKPSNYSPATSAVIRTICAEVFPPEYVAVVEGGRDANTELLEQQFDYIFFTGGVTVGKLVMEKASHFLTPVSLELGGKSPCIVDETADLTTAARRIVWGKFLNAGQTCIAPDYLIVSPTIKDELLSLIQKYIQDFYYIPNESTNGARSFNAEDFPAIITQKHFERLSALVDGSNPENGTLLCGGVRHAQTRQIEPTILLNPKADSPVMSDEIFGPILPVIESTNIEETIAFVRSRPKPLALYYFTQNKKHTQHIIDSLSFGGGCINDVIMHVSSSALPFGGVGNSGMGHYHGKASFDTFTHTKSVLHQSARIDVPFRYPPFSEKMLSFVKHLF